MSQVAVFWAVVGLGIAGALGYHSHATTFEKVEVSKDSMCGINSSGELYCRGEGTSAQPGGAFYFKEVSFDEKDVKVDAVRMSDSGACAKLSNGAAYCWGDMTIAGKKLTPQDPVKVATNVRDLAVGGKDVCIIDATHPETLKCSGETAKNRVVLPGVKTNVDATQSWVVVPTVMQMLSPEPLTSVMMSENNLCVSTQKTKDSEGMLMCGGSNAVGQLIPGMPTKQALPMVVVGNAPPELSSVVRTVGMVEGIVQSVASAMGANVKGENKEIVGSLFDKGIGQFVLSDNVLCGITAKGSEGYCYGGTGSFASKLLDGAKVRLIAADKDHVCVVTDKNALHCASVAAPTFKMVREEGDMDDIKDMRIESGYLVLLDNDGDTESVPLKL